MKPPELTTAHRYIILAAAFLGWMFSGVQMTVMNLASGSATQDFLQRGRLDPENNLNAGNLLVTTLTNPDEASRRTKEWVKESLKSQRPTWYARYNCAFLSGAALGGLIFGWLGDLAGRARAMGLSILCYSLFAGASYVAATPEQLLLLRVLCGMGVGGMWPTGISLAAEAWSEVSRPALSGLLGTSANIGIVMLSVLAYFVELTPDRWRWIMLVGATPVVLGVAVLFLVPESPAWLAAREPGAKDKPAESSQSLFLPPLLWLTIMGIAIGTIPLLGGWGVTSWFISWTEQANLATNYKARALTAIMRASGGSIGSLLGGWIANRVGRRTTYFLISLFSFATAEAVYLLMDPTMPGFAWGVFAVGCISTVYFGWLPLYLPELFPTHARATGAGISFNFGRILTALGVLATGAITVSFHENYRLAGAVMSLIYAAGMIVILFAPDTTAKKVGEG